MKGNQDPALDTTDMTQQEILERALRRERDRAQSYLDIAGVMIVALDSRGCVTLTNRKVTESLGYTGDELLGRDWFDTCFPADRRQDVRNTFLQLLADGDMVHERYENHILHKDGTKRLVAWHNALVRDETGHVVGTLSSGIDITESKKNQKQLELFRKLIDRSTDAIYVIDPLSGQFLDVSEQASRDTQYSRTELLNMRVMDLETAIPNEDVWQRVSVKIKQDGSMRMQGQHQRKDGSVFPVEISGSYSHVDSCEYILASVRDITERKNTEACLQATLDEWYVTFNSMTDLVSVHDRDFRIVKVNHAYCEALGIESQEALGKTCHEVMHGTHGPIAMCPCTRVLDTKQPQVSEFFEEHLGEHLEVSVSPIFDERGEVNGFVHLAKNITDRKHLEAELKTREEQFRILFEGSRDAIMTLDPDSMAFTSANGATLEIFRCPNMETFLSLGPLDLSPEYQVDGGLSREKAAGYMQTCLQEGANFFEWRHKRLNGETFPATVMLTHLSIKGKTVVLATVRDITEQKQAEQRQKELIDDLARVNNELKDFAYIVSHDLKAPLRSVETIAEWFIADYVDKLDEEGQSNLALMQTKTRRMRDLISGVLSYSRAGQLQDGQAEIALDELVKDVIDFISIPPSIEIHIDTPLPTVWAEETKMSQVFQNLIGNAVKYIDKPSGIIRIGCREETSDWHLYVSDNGPGIKEKFHDRIFQMFRTAPGPLAKESTGVGLTIVKKIVENMGGRIGVESQPGQGSTFTFNLPKNLKASELITIGCTANQNR